jgi:hypothetical protein
MRNSRTSPPLPAFNHQVLPGASSTGGLKQRQANMSKIRISGKASGIIVAAAVSLSFGAIQLAAGRDLASAGRDASPSQDATNDNGVNRAAKSDRADMRSSMVAPSQTISVHLDELAATSILIRLPARLAAEAQDRPAASGLAKDPVNARKSTVACEPAVSVLTEVAKRLRPGRCIT